MSYLLAKKAFSILTAESEDRGGYGLSRTLGVYQLTAIGIAATVGAGIFFVPDIIAKNYAGPAVVLCLLVSGFVCLIAGLCYAEIASMIPIAGSAYTYAYATLGEIFAWVIGWNLLLEYIVAAAATAAAWGYYMQAMLNSDGLHLPPTLMGHYGQLFYLQNGHWLPAESSSLVGIESLRHAYSLFNAFAILMVIAVTVILTIGIRESSNFSSWVVPAKLLALAVFIGLAGAYFAHHSVEVAANLRPFLPVQFGWRGLLTGSAIAFFCYSGIDSICTSAQETRNPQRDIPFAIVMTLCICGLLYVLVSGLMVGIVPYSKLGTGSGLVSALERSGSRWGQVVVEAGAIFGLSAACLTMLFGASRVIFSMSRDGLLLRWMGQIHSRFRTPWIASIVVGSVVAVLAAVAPIPRLVTLASSGSLITFGVVCVSVVVLRRTRPELRRPFRTPAAPYLPVIGVLCIAVLLVRLPETAWASLAVWQVVGLVLYFGYGRMHSTVAVRTSTRQFRHAPTQSADFELPAAEPPKELVEACATDDCVMVLGTGVAAQAGYPTWPELVNELLEWSIQQKLVSEASVASLRNSVQAGGHLDSAMDIMLHSADNARIELTSHLRDVFLERKVPSAVHNAIAAIKPAGVLVSSFDRTIEQVLDRDESWVTLTSVDGDKLLTTLTTRQKFLVNIYGDLEKPSSVLLGSGDYSDALISIAPFAQFMDALFFSRTLLFIGSSLDGLETFVKTNFLRTGAGSQTSKAHFACVPVSETSWVTRADVLRRRYSINVIPYRASPDHAELLTFMRRLQALVDDRRKSSAAVLSRTQPLRRVLFRNIGPFDELDISLDQCWNVLLGDNGVGKSTLLKALSLAIAGKDAEGYASRIIKADKDSATITLEAGQTYTVQLTRTEQGAEVKVNPPVRPLEAEGWLAIAFPPLRNASWKDTKLVPASASERPKTSDLLPMVAGDVDPRMERLKEWLVRLDYEIKDQRDKGSDAGREQRLFSAVFAAIQQLTPGVKVEFREVVAKTLRVMVETDDGVVPLEAVSQGTMSLISWVGILVQRMYQVYGGIPDIDPTKQFAIVIVDEIDVHMHPKWQQLIVGTLKNLFPKVQFIATTHSPLIVVGLGPEAVLLVRRDDQNRSKITVQQPSLETKGWRADQMLTGPLFNLTTSMDLQLFEKTKLFTSLVARPDLTPAQMKQLEALSSELNLKLPTAKEREEARIAFRVLEQSIDEKLAKVPVDKQKAILEEVRAQLQETMSDFRKNA